MFKLRSKDLLDLGSSMISPTFTITQIVINVLMALLCGLIIYWIYKKTFSGVLFSRNMGITMVMVSVVTSLIVMVITGNLALSLGMIGALSIVRFRTPIKDPKDTGYLFWSVATGIICGVSAYQLAVVSVIFIGFCLWVLSKRFSWQAPYLLVVHSKHPDGKAFTAILKKHCSRFQERSASMSAEHSESVYEILLKKDVGQELLRDLQAVRGVEKTVMVSYEGDLDEPR